MSDFLLPSVMTFAAFAVIFLFCEVGQRIIDESNEATTNLIVIEWYTYPMAIKKIYPIIIMGTNEPVKLCGMGNIVCTREAFKNVRH